MGGEIHIDSSVLELCRKGDSRAFRVLVEQLKEPAYYQALALLGNHDDALDISQEAFVKTWQSMRSFDSSRPFYPWYYTILKRLALNALRTRGRRYEVPADGLEWEEPLNHADMEEARQADRTAAVINRVMAKLTVDDREIISLKDVQGYAYKDIAIILAIPTGTVMSRLYTARARFRKLLQETAYDQ